MPIDRADKLLLEDGATYMRKLIFRAPVLNEDYRDVKNDVVSVESEVGGRAGNGRQR